MCDFTVSSRRSGDIFGDKLITTKNDRKQTFIWPQLYVRSFDVRTFVELSWVDWKCLFGWSENSNRTKQRQTNPIQFFIPFSAFIDGDGDQPFASINMKSICAYAVGGNVWSYKTRQWTEVNEPFVLFVFTEPCVSVCEIVRLINTKLPDDAIRYVGWRCCALVRFVCKENRMMLVDCWKKNLRRQQKHEQRNKKKQKLLTLRLRLPLSRRRSTIHQFFLATNCYYLRQIQSIF